MTRYLVLALAAALLTLTGCASLYGVVETDAALMTMRLHRHVCRNRQSRDGKTAGLSNTMLTRPASNSGC
jgi:hypothetical protein